MKYTLIAVVIVVLGLAVLNHTSLKANGAPSVKVTPVKALQELMGAQNINIKHLSNMTDKEIIIIYNAVSEFQKFREHYVDNVTYSLDNFEKDYENLRYHMFLVHSIIFKYWETYDYKEIRSLRKNLSLIVRTDRTTESALFLKQRRYALDSSLSSGYAMLKVIKGPNKNEFN